MFLCCPIEISVLNIFLHVWIWKRENKEQKRQKEARFYFMRSAGAVKGLKVGITTGTEESAVQSGAGEGSSKVHTKKKKEKKRTIAQRPLISLKPQTDLYT